MRLVLLTTDTTHHAYYAWKLAERFPVTAIFIETRGASPPFETFHPFEAERDAYERETLLSGYPGQLDQIAPVKPIESVNDAGALAALEALAPEVVLVFGTGRLHPP